MRTQPEDTNMQRPQTTANSHLVTHIHLILSFVQLRILENEDCRIFLKDFLRIFFSRKKRQFFTNFGEGYYAL